MVSSRFAASRFDLLPAGVAAVAVDLFDAMHVAAFAEERVVVV